MQQLRNQVVFVFCYWYLLLWRYPKGLPEFLGLHVKQVRSRIKQRAVFFSCRKINLFPKALNNNPLDSQCWVICLFPRDNKNLGKEKLAFFIVEGPDQYRNFLERMSAIHNIKLVVVPKRIGSQQFYNTEFLNLSPLPLSLEARKYRNYPEERDITDKSEVCASS